MRQSESNSLRHDPMFKLGAARLPFDEDAASASGATMSRFVVTSLPGLGAGMLYEEIYCARGRAENYIKHLKGDLAADRTSCTSFLANSMRLLLHAAAYVLHQQLRTQALQHTALSQAQPSTVIARLLKIAVQVWQCKNTIVLHLPSACPIKCLLQGLSERLYLPTPAKLLDSS